MKHLGALKNLFQSVCAFHTECEFGGIDYFGEGKPEEPGGMPSGSNERTANKRNSNSVPLPKRVPSLHLEVPSALTNFSLSSHNPSCIVLINYGDCVTSNETDKYTTRFVIL